MWSSGGWCRRRASQAWAACNAGLRLPGSRLSRPLPRLVHGKAGDPLTLGLLDNLLGEASHPPRGCLAHQSLYEADRLHPAIGPRRLTAR